MAIIRGFLLALIALLAILFASFWWLYNTSIAEVDIDQKLVALTYDDGPNPPYTQQLLDVLERHQVKATFFLVGRNVEAYPALARSLVESGHEIGNHSYHHKPMTTFSRRKMGEEIERTNTVLEQVLGFKPVLFRPPYGAIGPGLRRALPDTGMTSVLMDCIGYDWEETDPGKIAAHVLEDLGPGSIILLHDGHGDVADPSAQDSRAATVAATFGATSSSTWS